MVRIKERYLLVNILYPPSPADLAKGGVPGSVYLRQPTVDKLTFQSLNKAIRAQVAQLYGDYGAGALEENFVSAWDPLDLTRITGDEMNSES